MKKTAIIFLTLFISSCGNDIKQTDNPDKHKKAADHSGDYCYAWVSDKDSVLMTLHISGQKAQGDLSYNYFEKDKSSGTFVGSMSGDTLFATYTFSAEGTQSVRDIAFLKKGNDLVEGYGEAKEHNGKMVFNNATALDFSHSVLLKNRDCQ